MAQRLTRCKLARHAVDQYEAGAKLGAVMRQLAAHLIAERRVREAPLLVRAVEDELAARGIVIARVASASGVDSSLEAAIAKLTGAKKIHLATTEDPALLGGVRIETPGHLLDATVKRKLLALRRAKV